MSNKLIIYLLVLLAFFTVSGCGSSEPESYSNPAETISVKVNEEFVIALEANITTGFNWVEVFDESMLTLVNRTYIPDENEEGREGVGGTDHLRFKALQTGNTQIELTYKQPWEEDSEDDATLIFNVVIE